MNPKLVERLLARPIAHRGLHDGGLRPENSRRAFADAAKRGFAVELDVRLSADGAVMVFHDDTLERMTGEHGRVDETPEAQLASLRLLGTPETIPRLTDVLPHLGVAVAIEIKNESESAGELEDKVCAIIGECETPVVVMSFNRASVDRVASCAKGVARGFLVSPLSPGLVWQQQQEHLQELLSARAIDFVGCDVRGLPYPPIDALPPDVKRFGWTVRSAEEEAEARRWVDNVIFENYVPEVTG